MKVNTPAPQLLTKGNKRKIVLQPIGSIEQHGPFLPIDTDLRIVQLISEQLEVALNTTQDVLLLPPLPISCSWEHTKTGTISLQVSTLSAIIHNIARSLIAWETPIFLVILNWHGGNEWLGPVATEVTVLEQIPTAVIPTGSEVGKFWDQSGITTAKDIHAGAIETSIIQAFWPDLVPHSIPASAHCEPDIKPAKVQPVFQAIGSRITSTGIWGAPEDANPEKGKILIQELVKSVRDQIVKELDLIEAL